MENVFLRRRDRVRETLRRRGLDALVVSRPANRFYLTGFELHDPQPDESAGFAIVAASGEDWLATDPRYELAASELWPRDRLWIYGSQTGRKAGDLLPRVGSLIGFEASVPGFLRKLRSRSRGRFAPSLLDAGGIVEKLRERKDEIEIAALRASFALNHRALDRVEKLVADGSASRMSERDLAWDIERFFRENGAQELAFASIVARGANAALPHAVPGNAPIGSGVDLLTDIGCRVRDYCSDQTRTWWVGDAPPPEFTKTLELVKSAQRAALDIMRPGVPCGDAYAKAREVFEKAGAADAFNHSLGHGVGLQTHEAPSLSPGNKEPLRAGMTVTVEPGLYYPEWGGVRWEHTVLVVDDGVEIF